MNELYKFARDGIYSTLQTNPLNVMMGRSSCKARHSALVFASAFMTLHKADSAESVGHCNFHTPKTGEKKCQFLSPNGLYSCKMICSLPFLNKLHTVVSHLAMHTVQREIQQAVGLCQRHVCHCYGMHCPTFVASHKWREITRKGMPLVTAKTGQGQWTLQGET